MYVNLSCYFNFSKYQLLFSLKDINFNFSFIDHFPFMLKQVQFGEDSIGVSPGIPHISILHSLEMDKKKEE